MKATAVPCVGIPANTPAAVLVASLLCQIHLLEAHAGITFQELVNRQPTPGGTVCPPLHEAEIP